MEEKRVEGACGEGEGGRQRSVDAEEADWEASVGAVAGEKVGSDGGVGAVGADEEGACGGYGVGGGG